VGHRGNRFALFCADGADDRGVRRRHRRPGLGPRALRQWVSRRGRTGSISACWWQIL
jgi:hypothetical protein